jgi:hypothetical protein
VDGAAFSDFFAAWDSVVHDITNIVVEPGTGKVATEQHVDLVRDRPRTGVMR